MARVPITVMGYRCERCNHEWIPRDVEQEPSVCPKCKSPYWESSTEGPCRRYDDVRGFSSEDRGGTPKAKASATWTELRTLAHFAEVSQ